MGGVIWAYGNKTIAPYSEQFYVGGANSIRAFTVRSIGPGRFHPANNASYSYVDETGDIKLEANLEYRFRILSNFLGGNLNGATFLDAGNVWLMRKDEARPEAEFSLHNFFDSIAVGTGVGLRYDLSFLILRLDFGIALHVPYETGKADITTFPDLKTVWESTLPLAIHSKKALAIRQENLRQIQRRYQNKCLPLQRFLKVLRF